MKKEIFRPFGNILRRKGGIQKRYCIQQQLHFLTCGGFGAYLRSRSFSSPSHSINSSSDNSFECTGVSRVPSAQPSSGGFFFFFAIGRISATGTFRLQTTTVSPAS